MRYARAFILHALTEALEPKHPDDLPKPESLDIPKEPEPAPPGAPAVAPPGELLFSEEIMRGLERYKGKAILIQDFEGFMAFIAQIAQELKLNPAIDLPNIAAVFNSYRVAEGLEPL